MKTTRTIYANKPDSLQPMRKATTFLRADIWRRYGALGTIGKSNNTIRKEITKSGCYAGLHMDGTIRAETTKDVVNDILLYKAAAKEKVKSAIRKRTSDKVEQKRLYTLLKKDEWQQDNFLNRQMRKHFKRGVSKRRFQFVVRSDKFTTEVVDGYLIITIKVARRFGENIVLTTTTNGKGVDLTGVNIRVMVEQDHTEIHYACDKPEGRPCGNDTIGVDKGYTEALVDSDGDRYGEQFGSVMTVYSDKTKATNQQRNKLHALEKKHRGAGRTSKADKIRNNNLGCKKITARKEKVHKQLRTMAYKSVHAVVDKANVVASEDLTAVFGSKHQWKNYNRRMSSWAKGVLAEALEQVCEQRGCQHTLINPAYTSQMDSVTGLLEGKRSGDKFYRVNGLVLQADENAARNVKARLFDPDITRYTPFKEVRRILLSRSSGTLGAKRLELETSVCQPSADTL